MNRRGVSVLAVVLSLVLLAGAAGLLFSISWMSAREGEMTLRSTRVRLAGDAESERVLADWDPLLADTIPPGSGVALPGAAPRRGVTTRDSLFRLGDALYLLHVVAEERSFAGALLSRDGVARVVPLLSPAIPDSQAILALGPVSIDAVATVSGADQLPGGWEADCPPTAPPGAGARVAPLAPVAIACVDGTCLSGAPPVVVDSSLSTASLDRLGTIATEELAAFADQQVSGVVSVGPVGSGPNCDREVPTNWGDPRGTVPGCSRYFPILAAAGGTRVEGGVGQGVLIGLGRLELAGDFEFRGVVLGRGPVVLRDRARLLGTLLATDSVGLQDAAAVVRSVCAIDRVRHGTGRPNRRTDRGWIRWP